MRPRLPVRCRASRPFGTISRRSPRPFGLLITRSAPMVSHESGGVIRPRSLLTSRCYDADPVLAGRGSNQRWEFAAQSTLSTPPHGIAAGPPDRGTSRFTDPLRLQPPMAVDDLGLALPCERSDYFPAPPDFSTGTFHNRSTHNWSISEPRGDASGKGALIPTIHRSAWRSSDSALSADSGAGCRSMLYPLSFREFPPRTGRFLCSGRWLN